MKPRRTSSIQDVASAAGVSTATVSRVINNPALVAVSTAEKVQRAINDLGYKPNLFAQGLMTSRSHVLAIALPDIHGEFYSELLRGADDEASKSGYHLLVSPVHRVNNGTRGANLVFGLVDGLALMISEPNPALLEEAKRSNLPLVVLDADMEASGVDSVVVDNVPGTTEAAELLVRAVGAGRCFFVGGPPENYDTQQRARVFRQTLDLHKAPRDDERVAFGRYDVEWGRQWVRQRVASSGMGSLKGSGVLAGNDEIALGILQGAHEVGLSVPGDLRLIGFDDTRLGQIVRPQLSSVRVPMAEVGAAAVKSLIHRLDQPDSRPTCVRLPTKLVLRESSGV
ncbi:MAG: LacI family DNA-binding transcriptional regulator [Phycisphaerales bacterium]